MLLFFFNDFNFLVIKKVSSFLSSFFFINFFIIVTKINLYIIYKETSKKYIHLFNYYYKINKIDRKFLHNNYIFHISQFFINSSFSLHARYFNSHCFFSFLSFLENCNCHFFSSLNPSLVILFSMNEWPIVEMNFLVRWIIINLSTLQDRDLCYSIN